MAHRIFRVQALIAAVFFSVTSIAFAEDRLPHLDTSRPHALPGYPDQARREGKTGTTIIAVHVNELGKPFDVRTEKSSGSDELDNAAVFAVKQWRYVPAEYDGEPVDGWTAVGFGFSPDGVVQIEVPPETKIAEADLNRVVCKKQGAVTGSHIDDQPACMPKWQWEKLRRQKEEARRHIHVPTALGTGGITGTTH